MNITAIAPWFGSKRNLAPEIVKAIGSHTAYWEPFCGSLSVLFAKDVCTMETVNDLHGELINLARVCKNEDSARDLWSRLCRLIMHEDLFKEAAERYRAIGKKAPAPETPDVDRAENLMVCSWFGRNGVAGTDSYNQGFCVRYTKNGGHAATRWRSAVDSIPAWHERLRNVTILNRDAFGLLDRIEDAKGVAVYCDPPYIEKASHYVYDFEAIEHERLALALKRFKKTRVVVSYYEHEDVRSLYDGWTFASFNVAKAMAHQGSRGQNATRANELLITNVRESIPKQLFT